MLFPSRYAKQNGLKDKILALATETVAQLWDIENRDCNPNSKSQIPAIFSIPKFRDWASSNPGISGLKTGIILSKWLQKSSHILKIIVLLHSYYLQQHTADTYCLHVSFFTLRSSKKSLGLYSRPIDMQYRLIVVNTTFSPRSHNPGRILKLQNPRIWKTGSGLQSLRPLARDSNSVSFSYGPW